LVLEADMSCLLFGVIAGPRLASGRKDIAQRTV